MAGLIFKLRPYEEFLVNGVLVQNGDRKARLRVKTAGASIMRVRDAMKPEEATTAERRAYYVAQLAVSGEMSEGEAGPILRRAIETLGSEYAGRAEIETIRSAADELAQGKFYNVMRKLGDLVGPRPAIEGGKAAG